MRVLYAVVCEDAHERDDGRVDLLGIFHQLYAPGFPAQQDRLTLVVVLEWDGWEAGRIDFSIDLLDPSGSPALSINGHTDVSAAEVGAPPQTRLVMPMEGIVFPVVGSYDFVFEGGEHRVRLAPLHLIQDPGAHIH